MELPVKGVGNNNGRKADVAVDLGGESRRMGFKRTSRWNKESGEV